MCMYVCVCLSNCGTEKIAGPRSYYLLPCVVTTFSKQSGDVTRKQMSNLRCPSAYMFTPPTVQPLLSC